jgi:hypothetical protein
MTASPKTIAYLENLGVSFAPNITQAAASALLDQAKAERNNRQITDRMKVKRFAVGASLGWKGSEDDQLGYAYCNLQIDLLDSLAAFDRAERAHDSAGQMAALESLVNKVRSRLTVPLKTTLPSYDVETVPF